MALKNVLQSNKDAEGHAYYTYIFMYYPQEVPAGGCVTTSTWVLLTDQDMN